MLSSNVTYQRETLSERPIRQPLRLWDARRYMKEIDYDKKREFLVKMPIYPIKLWSC